MTTDTTTDPPTLAEKLRDAATYLCHAEERAVTHAADVLAAFNPRLLTTGEALAALTDLPDGCTVEMDSIGDVFVSDRGQVVARVAPLTATDGYSFAGGKYERLDEAVLVAWVRTRPSVGAGQ